ncbi:8387_t:CDS:1, partial [Funneliformis geosporum]
VPYKDELNARSKLIDDLIGETYALISKLNDSKKQGKILTEIEKLREEKDKLINDYEQ